MDLYMMQYTSAYGIVDECLLIATSQEDAISKIKQRDEKATEIKVLRSKVISTYVITK